MKLTIELEGHEFYEGQRHHVTIEQSIEADEGWLNEFKQPFYPYKLADAFLAAVLAISDQRSVCDVVYNLVDDLMFAGGPVSFESRSLELMKRDIERKLEAMSQESVEESPNDCCPPQTS